MFHDVTDLLIACYCFLADSMEKLFSSRSLRRSGPPPALTDAEVLTIAVVAELLGHHTDKAIWLFARSSWRAFFPRLGSRSAFVRQLAGLWSAVQSIQTLLVRWLQLKQECFHIVDGFPIRVCRHAVGGAGSFEETPRSDIAQHKKKAFMGLKGMW